MSHHNVVRSHAVVRRRSSILSLAAIAALLGVFAASAAAASPEAPGETFPVSVTPAGAYANGEGSGEFTPVSISADGRYVAFESASTNLGEAGPAGVYEGFVKDLASGAVRLVSRADGLDGEPAGEPGIANLQLSGDGSYAIFTSAATNLGTDLPGEEAGERHVYRRDLQTGETALVDRVTGAEGAIFSRGAEAEAISDDGRYVVFVARVENLEDTIGDHSETANGVVYVRDMQSGTTVAVSRAEGEAGEVANEPSEAFSISPDGRYVAFSSAGTNLAPGTHGERQVYVRDLQSAATTLVSQNVPGEVGDRSSEVPVLVGEEGCEVAFGSIAFNLLAPSPLPISGDQIYVENHCSGQRTMTLVSQNDDEIANFAYNLPGGATADGHDFVFAAEFPPSSCCHLFLRNIANQQISQLDRASGPSGASANQSPEWFAISANGCRAVFNTRATNLFGAGPPQEPGGEQPVEVYARQISPCVVQPGGPGVGQPPASKGSSPATAVAVSADLELAALSHRRLVVSLTAPGRISVRVRRLVEQPRRHWRFLRTIGAEVGPGRTEVPLPDFAAGRYRFNVHLDGSRSPGIVRVLAIGG